MAWLSRFRGGDGSLSMTSVVATLVVVAVSIRIVDMFVDVEAASDQPQLLYACGYWTLFGDPAFWAPVLVLLLVFIWMVVYAVSGGLPRM